jgi:hypothetical protein
MWDLMVQVQITVHISSSWTRQVLMSAVSECTMGSTDLVVEESPHCFCDVCGVKSYSGRQGQMRIPESILLSP